METERQGRRPAHQTKEKLIADTQVRPHRVHEHLLLLLWIPNSRWGRRWSSEKI
jgi:hypothetical protein